MGYPTRRSAFNRCWDKLEIRLQQRALCALDSTALGALPKYILPQHMRLLAAMWKIT